MCKGLGGSVTVLHQRRELAPRVLAEGEAPPPVEDGKGVESRVDEGKAGQASRLNWKLAPEHPWVSSLPRSRPRHERRRPGPRVSDRRL